jgi:hypothetical protein
MKDIPIYFIILCSLKKITAFSYQLLAIEDKHKRGHQINKPKNKNPKKHLFFSAKSK